MALAMLAAAPLLLRLLLPMAPMPAAPLDALAELLAGGGICSADAGTPGKTPSPMLADCLLCPLCTAPVPIVLATAPPLPAQVPQAETVRHWWPPSVAPPAAPYRIAHPRGPPAHHG
jgi:hypothetical protein